MFLAKFNPYRFVLGSQCVPLSGYWEWESCVLVEDWIFSFSFSFSFSSLLCIQTFSMDPTVYAIRDLD